MMRNGLIDTKKEGPSIMKVFLVHTSVTNTKVSMPKEMKPKKLHYIMEP